MVRAPREFFNTVVWRQFSDLHTDLWLHFEETTDQLIRKAVHSDTSDAETVPAQIGGRIKLVRDDHCGGPILNLTIRKAAAFRSQPLAHGAPAEL